MKDTSGVRERIIEVTTKLIQDNKGDIRNITSRKIASESGVGLGLINYHFGSKDQLITMCVQKIIDQVVSYFTPAPKKYEGDSLTCDRLRLADWAKQVFNFLFLNEAISFISITEDMKNYTNDCNSVNTQKGFSMAIQSPLEPRIKQLLIFTLTSTMQIAFLSRDESVVLLGYDFQLKEERDAYIEQLVAVLFTGLVERM